MGSFVGLRWICMAICCFLPLSPATLPASLPALRSDIEALQQVLETEGQAELNIVWLGRASKFPIHNMVDQIFSEASLGHSVGNTNVHCGEDGFQQCESVYLPNAMVVVNVGFGDSDMQVILPYLQGQPQNNKMGLFVIGDSLGTEVPKLLEQFPDVAFVFRLHYIGIGDKVHWLPHGPSDKFVQEYSAQVAANKPTLQDWGSRELACSFMGTDSLGYSKEQTGPRTAASNEHIADREAMMKMTQDNPNLCEIKIASGWTNDTTSQPYASQMAESKFALVPSGLGPESFRLYEAMLLRSIPVMTKGQLHGGITEAERSNWVVLDSWQEWPNVYQQVVADPATAAKALHGPALIKGIIKRAKEEAKVVLDQFLGGEGVRASDTPLVAPQDK